MSSITDEINQSVTRTILIMLAILIGTAVVIIKQLENLSWTDAIYFTIVTISTVGFGDIYPKHPLTKIVVIVLIISGITSIAIISQAIVDTLIKNRLQKLEELPSKPLELKNHVVVAGYSSIGKLLVKLLKQRGFEVVVVDIREQRFREATISNKNTIKGDISSVILLSLLSLEQSAGIFLTMDNDNLVIKTTVVLKNLYPNLPIIAEVDSLEVFNIRDVIELDYAVSVQNAIKRILDVDLFHPPIQLLSPGVEEVDKEGKYKFFMVPDKFIMEDVFSDYLELGRLSLRTRSFYPSSSDSFDIRSNRKVIAIPVEDVIKNRALLVPKNEELAHEKIILAGFPEYLVELIDSYDFDKQDILVLSNSEIDFKNAEDHRYRAIRWDISQSKEITKQYVTDNSLIVLTWGNIADSLVLISTAHKEKSNTHIIQLADLDEEIEPYIHSGATTVILHKHLIAGRLLQSFIAHHQLASSVIFSNGHLFEIDVVTNDQYEGKSIEGLEKEGLQILSLIRNGKSIDFYKKFRLKVEDVALVFIAD